MGQVSGNSQTRQSQLEEAFRSFNTVSEQLAQAYGQLQQRVARLSEELAASRSERMRQLAEKERLANRLSTLLDALPGGVLVLDGESRITQFNLAAQQLFPRLEQTTDDWHRLFSQAREVDRDQQLYQLPSGTLIKLIERSLDPEPGSILLILDITETWQLKQRLERRQRLTAMGEMAAQLAHQIRTPLSSALLYSRHLGREDLTPEQRERFAGQCHERLQRIERQITDMLTFTRGGGFTPDEIDLGQLLDELCRSFEPLSQSHGGQILCHVESARGVQLRGNREALFGAFSNLISNAFEQAESPLRLQLDVAVSGSRVHLCFSDNGPGIPESIQSRIFDPFFTTRPEGTGLGLAVVQSVVLAHGGAVRVQSQPGCGCSFLVELPVAQSTGQNPSRGAWGLQAAGGAS